MKLKVNRSIGWNLEYATMNVTQIITDGADCYPWRQVFALWPVKTVSGKRIWWKKIYKRKVWVVWGTGFHMEPETQYATLFDMLQYNTTNELHYI
jgi:hypothetical protein